METRTEKFLVDNAHILMRGLHMAVLGAERDAKNPAAPASIRKTAREDVTTYWDLHAAINAIRERASK